MLDPINELRASLDVLSRREIEEAWRAAANASKALGTGNHAQRAEMAAFLLASILSELGGSSQQQDLADVLPAVDALATYVCGRMAVIATDAA